MKKNVVVVYIIMIICGLGVFVLQFSYGRKHEPYTLYQVYLDDEVIGTIKSKKDLEKHISSQGSIIQKQVLEYQDEVEVIDEVYQTMNRVINNKNTYYNRYTYLTNLENKYHDLQKYIDDNGIITGEYKELEKAYNSLPNNYTNGTSLSKDKIENYDLIKEKFDNDVNMIQEEIVDYLYQNRDSLNLTSSEYSSLEEFEDNQLNDINYSKYVTMSNYIDDNSIYLHTDDIYEPLGINIKKITTYDDTAMSTDDVYNKIVDRKPCTIEGYQFRIKADNNVTLSDYIQLGAVARTDYDLVSSNSNNDVIIYVTDEDIFNEAIEEVTAVFVGRDNYNAYVNNTQKSIKTTGSTIDNIYLTDEITVKKTNISVKEKIYTDASELSSFILYGDNVVTRTVSALASDTIDDFAYRNGISIEEFFLSNPSFTSIDNMFYDGQPITITKLNPKVSLVVEESRVIEQPIYFNVVEKYDNTMSMGSEYIEEKGENGTMRVSQKVIKTNGSTTKVDTLSNETIKAAKDRVVRLGTKVIPTVGSLSSWLWPTNSYSISSYFGWRVDPFSTKRKELHTGLDITNKAGAPIYASNNGTIMAIKNRREGYGKHIIIDHHNGYYTLYGHMSGFAKGLKENATVSRGQIIGYVGMTGAATGNHVHFEIRRCPNYSTKCFLNPLSYLRR